MSYRPDGWEETLNEILDRFKITCMSSGYRQLIEAGADALVEGLKGEGVFTYGNHTPDIDLDDAKEESGYWVFIPEE